MSNHDENRREIELMQINPDYDKIEEICERLDQDGDGIEYVSELLKILENNPNFDFGSPGPIVHTLEKFFRRGYEEQLIASINRNPTAHALWMLNRIINGCTGEERFQYLELMKKISMDKNYPDNIRDAAKSFLH